MPELGYEYGNMLLVIIEALAVAWGTTAPCFLHESEGTLMGTPNRQPQDYRREYHRDIPTWVLIPVVFLLQSWGSLFGVPIEAPFSKGG